MAWYEILAVIIGGVLFLMAMGVPVAFGFFAINILGAFLFQSGSIAVRQLLANAAEAVSTFSLVPVPLFIVMGAIFFRSGLAVRVFDALDACFGRLPGRLSYVTVTGGTVFAALSGSSMANTGMMGTLMVPEMVRRGYKRHMALGPVLGSGGLAVIIPPSALGVLLGSLANIDIGALLIAGILPGFILAVLYFGLIYLQVKIDPKAAPQYDVEHVSFARQMQLVAVNVLPMGLIIFLVVGLIILGIATPSESAAFGIAGVVILTLLYRVLSWDAIKASLMDATKVTAMSLLLIMASTTFSQMLAFTGASRELVEWSTSFNLQPVAMLLVMFGVLIVLGMFMDQLSMMLLTLPIFLPLSQTLGFDTIWFGIIMLLALEISFTTPPFGLLLFVMLGVAPEGTTLPQVALAALPYILCAFILVALLIMFPQIALYLPSLMAK
jgi:tripartite ATP-independent transporter DctM subunit